MDAFSVFVNTDETIDPLDCTPSTPARQPAKGDRKPDSGALGQPKAERPSTPPGAAAKPAVTTKQRRVHNRELAFNYARAGVYVLLAEDKKPLTLDHGRRDIDIPKAEREAIRAAFVEKHGFEPLMIGSTRSIATLRRAFDENPDAVPAINGGPNGLLILDADEKDDGPRLLAEWFKNDPPPPHPVTKTQGGGEHHYFRNPFGYGCKAGIFKRDLGTDVKGEGGYVIAQGAIRKDGKSYTPKDATNLVEWFMTGNDNGDPIPDLPHAVCVELEKVADVGGATVATGDERDMVERLHDEVDEYAFDPELGLFDIPKLLAKDPAFARAWTGEEANGSVAHFHIVRGLRREYGDKFEPAHALLAIEASEAGLVYSGNKSHGPGEYNDRDIARDYLKAMKDNVEKSHIVDGSAFGDVSSLVDDEEDDTAHLKRMFPKALPLKFASDVAAEKRPVEWRVDFLVPERGVGVVYGASTVGKSFFLMSLLNSVARGVEWFGRRVMKSAALYVYGEGDTDMSNRLRALEIHDGELGNVVAAPIGANSLFSNRAETVKAIVQTARVQEHMRGEKVGIVVLDTLATTSVGVEENSAKDIGIVLGAAREIATRLDCVVLIVHHEPKGDTTMRGSSALMGNTDFVLHAEREMIGKKRTGVVRVGPDKQKFGPNDVVIEYRFKKIDLGVSERGTPQSSLVVVPKGEGMGDVSAEEGAADVVEPVTRKERNEASRKTRREDLLLAIVAKPEGTRADWGEAYVSDDTLTGDLKALVDAGLMKKFGKGKGTRWVLTDAGRTEGDRLLNERAAFIHPDEDGECADGPIPTKSKP